MPKVVYVLGLGHSGSTLLDLLLSGHPEVCGVGEARMLTDPNLRQRHLIQACRFACSCRSPFPECPLWKKYLEFLRSKGNATIEEGYHSLLDAFSDVVGREAWMSDSSKERRTLATLKRAVDDRLLPIADFRVIHLVKDVRAFVTSIAARDARRGVLNAIRICRLWRCETREDVRILDRLGLPLLRIGYEELCLFPESTINRICQFLGIEFVPKMLAPQPASGHVGIGNPMRRDQVKSARLHYDNRWFLNSDVTTAYHLIPGLSQMNRELVYSNSCSDPFSPTFLPPASNIAFTEDCGSDVVSSRCEEANRV